MRSLWSYGDGVGVPRVERAKTAVGLFRRIVIEVDGQAVLRVGWGKTVEVAIEPGQHAVRARADWQTSPILQVHISADERLTVRVTHPLRSIRKLPVEHRLGHAHRAPLTDPKSGRAARQDRPRTVPRWAAQGYM